MEEIGGSSVLYNLCVFLDCVDSEIKKLFIVVKEYGGWCFLIITTITRIKDLDSYFSLLIGEFGSDCKTEWEERYPEQPVPKSIAMT